MTLREFCGHLAGMLRVQIRCYQPDGSLGWHCPASCPPPPPPTWLTAAVRSGDPAPYVDAAGAVWGTLDGEGESQLVLGPLSGSADAMERLCRCLSLLEHQLRDRYMAWETLLPRDAALERALEERLERVSSQILEQGDGHNAYAQERREQDSIRRGDVDALLKSFQELSVSQLGVLSATPLRQAKDLSIVVAALSSRSAIAGGLQPELAFSMVDAFVQQMEEMTQTAQVYYTARQLEIQLTRLVRQCRRNTSQSRLTTRCKEAVAPRLHQKLTVRALAQVLEVSPDYLSHVFARDEGMPLTDYINLEKIRLAQHRLLFSQESYKTIAYTLGFSSQSHFGQVFKRWTGMTPRQYREQYRL